MNITESRLPQDGSIKGTFGQIYLDMRVSCLPTNEGEKIVIRILDYTRSLQGLEHWGFSHPNFLKLKQYADTQNSAAIPLCVKIEEELAALDDSEKDEMLALLGIEESGFD